MNIEEYIKQNKEEFDLQNPPEGHFERFELRLAKSKKKTHQLKFYKYSAIAASCLFLLALGSFFFLGNPQTQECTLSPELAEMRTYYETRINQLVNKIEILSADVNPELATVMLNDANRIQEEVRNMDYCLLAANGKAVKSTVKRYNLELDALSNMLAVLEQNQTITSENNNE